MRYHLVLLAMVGALAPAGCGGSDGAGTDPGAAFPGRAVAVAEAWVAATERSEVWKSRIVALQSLTMGRIPDDARFRATITLPREAPSPAKVTLSGEGDPVTVPLVSGATAYAELVRARVAPPCDAGLPSGGSAMHACTSLTVTGATMGTVELRTNRGLLPVPAWLFTVDGAVASPIARVAVDPATFGIPPQAEIPPWGEPDVAAIDRLTRVEPGRIEYTIGVSACATDPVGYVHETRDVVVVGGYAQPKPGPCIGALKLVPVTVALASPLAARPILDSVTGRVLL